MFKTLMITVGLLGFSSVSYADWDMRPENLSPKELAMQKPCSDASDAFQGAYAASVAAGKPLDHEARIQGLKVVGAACEQWNDYVGKKHKGQN